MDEERIHDPRRSADLRIAITQRGEIDQKLFVDLPKRGLPEREPGMRSKGTGRMIAQEWEKADDARRREMLTEFEVRVVLHPTGHAQRVAITGIDVPEGYELAD